MSHDAILDDHILSIIQTEKIREQVDLQQILKERGYDIPQATLSRRLKKLKIAKVGGVYQAVELNSPNLPLILHIKTSESGLIVLHTLPGSANSLGAYIDQKYVAYSPKSSPDQPILGTIAGDDTVLLITKSANSMESVLKIFKDEFPYLNID